MSDGNVRATARLGLGSSLFFFRDKRREARGERGPPSEEGSRRRQRGLVVRETYTVYHHRSSASYRGGVAFRGVRALVILFIYLLHHRLDWMELGWPTAATSCSTCFVFGIVFPTFVAFGTVGAINEEADMP